MMSAVINLLLVFGLLAVFGVLALGIFNMMRGGPANRSQLFMRWRVILQFAVICLVMASFYFLGPTQ